MAARAAHQQRVIDDMHALAWSRLDIQWTPPEPEFDSAAYVGDWMPHADAWELWLKWEEHAFMPDPGGYWDQHPLWRAMIHSYRRLYRGVSWNVRMAITERDERDKRDKRHG